MRRANFKQGELRAALVDAAMALIAEKGVEALSVAELTRRLGVSSSAPYQHFAGRQDLLAAAAAQAARDLAIEMRRAVRQAERRSGTGGSAEDALAATAVVYATFVAQRRAGLDFIFAAELTQLKREGLIEARRGVIDVLLPLTMAIARDADEALRLMERHICAAHGLGALSGVAFGRRRANDLADLGHEAVLATRTLVAAVRLQQDDSRSFSDTDFSHAQNGQPHGTSGAGAGPAADEGRQFLTTTPR